MGDVESWWAMWNLGRRWILWFNRVKRGFRIVVLIMGLIVELDSDFDSRVDRCNLEAWCWLEVLVVRRLPAFVQRTPMDPHTPVRL